MMPSFYEQYMLNTTIQYCYVASNGGAIFANGTNFTIINSTIKGNQASIGGGISSQNCTFNIQNSDLDGNMANSGGSFYIVQGSNMTLENVSIRNSTALVDGGSIYWDNQTIPNVSSQFTIVGELTIKNSLSLGNGGSIYLNDKNFSLSIDASSKLLVNGSTAYGGYGGVIYSQNSKQISIGFSSFSNLSSKSKGSFLFSQSTDLILTLLNVSINCKVVPL